MAESTIHEVCLREDQSGEFNFSFKALEGYMFTGDPYIYSINGQEWDTTGGVMTFSFGTDYRERWGDGLGIHGTQTVNITLNYDIPDLNPQDDNTNKIKIDFFVKKMLTYCLSSGYTYYLTFGGLGGAPIINGHTPITGQTSATYWGQNSTGVYVFAGMGMGTYAWYVDSETDALTLYSENGNINISATHSKTVFISTSVYQGNVTLYWGTIVLEITGDFDKATMLFSNGHRNTSNWFRYKDSCTFSYSYNPVSRGSTKTLVTRRDDCELWATNELRRELITASSGTQLVSNSNGYSFSQVYQGRRRRNSDQTEQELIEPYGRLYRRGNTLISVKAYGTIAQATWQDVSHDNGETWTRIDDTQYCYPFGTAYPETRNYWLWSDMVYAGFSETDNDHVWYALVHYTAAGAINGSYYAIVKSVDDAASFQRITHPGSNHSPDFRNITTDFYYLWNGRRGRLFVDLEKDYIFVFFYSVFKGSSSTDHTNPQFILYRGFPSLEDATNGIDLRPVIASDAQTGGVSSTYNGIDFDYEYVIIVDRGLPEPHLPLSINDNGFCIFTTKEHYLVSWNFGLNWTRQTNLPTITQAHTNGTTYTYPEWSPTPVFWQGRNLILTSHTQEYSANHPSYRRNQLANIGLLYGVMEVLEKNEEGWITGNIPQSWNDYQTFGVVAGLTSSAIGPYDSTYGSPSVIYGDNILFHIVGSDPNQDPNFSTFYWYSWNIVNQTTTSTGNTAGQTPAGLSISKLTAYGNKILGQGDINGPVSAVDEDWVLFESTDGGTNFTPIYTHPDNLSYIKSILCKADGTDPFIGLFHRRNPEFTFSFDSGSTWTVLSNPSAFTSYNDSSKFAYTDGYLWIMESRNYSSGRKSWILPANQTVLSDANNWAPYEVDRYTSGLYWHTSPIRQFAAYGQKGIVQHGDFLWWKTTDRGQTWTQIPSITTTDNVTYNNADLQTWNYGLDVNSYTGEFIVQIGDYNSSDYLVTYDFVTWTPISYDPSDADGDNNPNLDVINVMPAPNGNWYALIREAYGSKPRLFNLSESIPTAPPTYDRLVEQWDIIKEYTVTDTNSATNSNYRSDGFWSAHIMNITKDYEFSDGIPRMLITRSYAIDIIPPPPAPTIVNGSLEEEITYPAFPSVEDLVYDVTVGHMRFKHIHSNKPFGVMYIDRNERLHKMDGVFNIITMSITEPIVVKSQDDQVINYGQEEEIPIDTVITAGTSIFYPSMTYTHNYGGYGFAVTSGYPGNPTVNNHVENHAISADNVWLLNFFLNRDDVPNRQNITSPSIATSYLSDFARPIPSGYFFKNIQTVQGPIYYGVRMIFFPPRDRVYINVVGMKLYSDPYGTPYLDGYYKAEDIISDYFGHYNTGNGGDGIWENIEETDYMVVKNGIVIEVGHSKNLPDYDQC